MNAYGNVLMTVYVADNNIGAEGAKHLQLPTSLQSLNLGCKCMSDVCYVFTREQQTYIHIYLHSNE